MVPAQVTSAPMTFPCSISTRPDEAGSLLEEQTSGLGERRICRRQNYAVPTLGCPANGTSEVA